MKNEFKVFELAEMPAADTDDGEGYIYLKPVEDECLKCKKILQPKDGKFYDNPFCSEAEVIEAVRDHDRTCKPDERIGADLSAGFVGNGKQYVILNVKTF